MRLVIGFSPGSASDNVAQALAPELERRLGQPVEIERHPGGNGVPAARLVARSRPDGATLFVATLGTHALAPYLDPGAGYDPLTDFTPVALVARSPLILACHPSLPVATVPELIALARAQPGTVSYGSSAFGGAPHLAAALFEHMAGVTLRHVRFEQTSRLYRDLCGGRVDLSFNNPMSMLPRLAERALRGLAVTAATRSPVAPELPTLAEAGLPGYDVSNWVGIVAPGGMPEETTCVLAQAIAAALQSDTVTRSWSAAGIERPAGAPGDFAAFLAQELERWGPVARRLTAGSRP